MAQDTVTETRSLWREGANSSGRTPIAPRPHVTRALLVMTGLLLALATAFGMVSWLVGTPQTHFVSCWVTKFRDPAIPPNPPADCDRAALRDGHFFVRSDVASMPIQSRFLMTQQLDALTERSKADNVVLYVATYAIVDAEGRIVLLTSDYDPGQPASGLLLRQVLQSLKKSPARHKLLVLDICWPYLIPAVTGGAGDVAAALPKELDAVADDHRLVLCSCSPGQIALTSETMGRSVFGYYFEQALQGDADNYNSNLLADGRVTVREAAQLIAARVDRWAMHNRARRQTPTLIGAGEDFELTVCNVQSLVPPEPTKLPKYPAWLLEGWKLRERWLGDGTARIAPRLVMQLQAELLRYERKWRFTHSDAELKSACEATLAEQTRKSSLYRDLASGPAPPSLAAVVASGHTVDPKATDAVSALLKGLKTVSPTAKTADRQAALQKLLAAFDKQTKEAANVDVALAVFEAAVTQTRAEPDQLETLITVLHNRQLADQWIETRFLDRLAARASVAPAGTWGSAQASRMLRIVQQSEQAFCKADAMPWSASRLEAAAQGRHNAEFDLWSPGYVPADAMEQAISQAELYTEDAAAHQALFVDAWKTYSQTMLTLPWYSCYVNRYPAGMASWAAAVDATSELADLLEAEALAAQGKQKSSGNSLEALRRATKKTRTAMDAVAVTFTSDSVDRLVRRCKDQDARPNVFAEIDAVLATPLLQSADRARLWLARATLARRFHDGLALLDYEEKKDHRTTIVLSGFDPNAAMREEASLAKLQAQVSLDLLQLGGVAVDSSLENDLVKEETPFTCKQAGAIADLWQKQLRSQIEAARNIGEQERLSRVFQPLRPMGLLDNPETNPVLRLIMMQRHDLWAWQADRYRYETRDGVDPEFYAKLAVQFAPYLKKTKTPTLQIDALSELEDLAADDPAKYIEIPWTINTTADSTPSVQVSVLNPASPWLTVNRQRQPDEHGLTSPATFGVSLARNLKYGPVIPQGFVLVWSLDGRDYHQRIKVPALADQSRLAVLLSTDPKNPEPGVERVQLRSNAAPSAYHLYVQNRGRTPRSVLIQLNTGAVIAAPLELPPGQTLPVTFAPATPGGSGEAAPQQPKTKELPELKRPLEVVVLDATNQKELTKAVFPVEIIEPRQFVAVDHVRFTPKDDKNNRLEIALRQTGPLPGPPCPVKLNVDANHVPGLVGMGDGVFQGKLPANGSPLVMFVRNLQLADGPSEQGTFSLTIDGIPRAMVFDTTFARSGNPTTPVEAIRPALRLSAPATGHSGNPFAAHVETDYAPASSTLEVALGRSTAGGNLQSDSVVKLVGGRRHRVGFTSAGKGGALEFDAQISDWNVPLDTAGIVGHRVLQVRLLASDGRELAIARQEVVLGDRPPQGIVFEDAPKEATNKRPLELSASARQSIPEVSTVTFFVGKPQNDAIPKNAVTASATVDAASQIWSGALTLKPDVKGKIPVSAQFTNAAGLSSFVTTTIDVTDADIGGGKIEGKVVEGTIPQAGVAVVLSDDKGAQKAQATTAADGSFSFQSLKPGKYVASAAKPDSGRKGSAPVEVTGESTVEANIELWL